MNKHGKTKYKLLENFEQLVRDNQAYPNDNTWDAYLEAKAALERKLDKMSKEIRSHNMFSRRY